MLCSLPQMLQCYIAHPHMFLYLQYFSPKTKLSRRGQRLTRKSRREAGSLGGAVGWCVSVTLACLMGSFYVQYVYSLLWLLSWEVTEVVPLLLVGLRPGLGRTKS